MKASRFFTGMSVWMLSSVALTRPGIESARVVGSASSDRKSTRLNSSHVSISYAVLRALHSFPTRRSSDLLVVGVAAEGDVLRDGVGREPGVLDPQREVHEGVQVLHRDVRLDVVLGGVDQAGDREREGGRIRLL